MHDVLVILIPGFPKDEEDSTCLPAQQRMVRGINQYYPNVEVVIITFQYPFVSRTYDWYGNKVIALGGKNRGGFFRRYLWSRACQALNKLHREKKILGVLGFWGGECSLVGKKWSAKNEVPFFCWVMGQDAMSSNHFFRKANIQPGETLSISDHTAGLLRKNHQLYPVRVIPIGIDPGWVTHTSYKKDIAIVCAGSLIPLKQYELCIAVMKAVTEKIPKARMIIAGKGPEEEKLLALTREKKLDAHILFAGEQSHADTLELMARGHVFLHPSSSEGFSMACLEALACGAEVVSFLQPMKEPIPKWHQVNNMEEMINKTVSILSQSPDEERVYPYSLLESIENIMQLFGIETHENVKQPVRCSVG